MVNGEFQFYTGPAIKPADFVKAADWYRNQYSLPLTVMGKRKTAIDLPITAEHRGTARMKGISYTFPHLFNFWKVTLTYSAQFYTEFVVFPSLLPVRGFEEVVHMMQGKQWSLFSPFEDVQLPVGTREYHYSDPFHRINWKASAKTQTLQTNVYEKNVDMGLVFIVNISVADNSHLTKLSKHLERSLSFCAYLCKIATEKGYHTSYSSMRANQAMSHMCICRKGKGKHTICKHWKRWPESIASPWLCRTIK